MTLSPRVVLVHRQSEYDELVGRHGSPGQAAFFLSTRGRDIAEVLALSTGLAKRDLYARVVARKRG